MIPLRLTLLAALFVSGAAFAQTSEPFQAEPAKPLLPSNVAGSRQHVGLEATGVGVGSLGGGRPHHGFWLCAPK